ncbi:MAG: 2-C-methyl-D-erythritol 4-phosphate cytidylyltransferase [Anaeroplasmataceae bacterium]
MFSVIIPMAGSGQRAKTKINKALTLINDKPMFLYSYELFKSYGFEIVLVCKEAEIPEIKKYVSEDTVFAIGGETRAHSVYNGLLKCSNECVMIHDAARPFISKDIIDNIIEVMKNARAAYVGIKARDTLRDVKNKVLINREDVIIAQTPQVVYKNDLINAYLKGFKDGYMFTDDISAIEKYCDIVPAIVEGNDFNFKVTTPYDIKLAHLVAKGGLQ